MDLYLISKMPPSVNHYLAYRVVRCGNKNIAQSYKTKEAVTYQNEFAEYVKQEVKKQGWQIDNTVGKHLYVDCIFYFPKVRMDCNNYFKVMLDAITNTGAVWADDNIVCERVSRIYYDTKNPRIEIHIHPVDYFGVFDNKNNLDEFESKCKSCKRYARNCSILRNAKQGHIAEGIHPSDLFCQSYKDMNRT